MCGTMLCSGKCHDFIQIPNVLSGFSCMISTKTGPIASSFVNKYGCRAVTIAGSILTSACFFASYYATNVITLIFTIGFGVGCGFGMIYLPVI